MIKRFYREFQVIDLPAVINAPYQETMARGHCQAPRGLSAHRPHFHYYVERVFPAYVREFRLDTHLSFAQYTRLEDQLMQMTEAPLYLLLR